MAFLIGFIFRAPQFGELQRPVLWIRHCSNDRHKYTSTEECIYGVASLFQNSK